ncbi:caspase domain-containing protein [Streptomyces sp. NPDC056304]|uniref:caspase family protein n=1 Tax=Streptomyces sp. NPDC056304 TaxID=3345778 RepID=UPI0035DBC5CA
MSDAGPLHDYSRSRAVLIGVSKYDRLPSAEPAANSLKRMKGLLTGPLCSWPQNRVQVWEKDDVQQRDRLPDQLMEAFDGVKDIALFYFVGHGQLYDDELCLALQKSPEYGPRCKTVGLPFSDVRDALRACDAQTKIVILDCCFAGRAREHSLAPESANVIDWTHAKGAATLAASGAYRTAWYEPDSGMHNPQTYFTKYLIDVIEQGVPGYSDGLPLSAIYDHAAHALVRDKRPEPTRSVLHDAGRFILARNVAEPVASLPPPPLVPQPQSAETPTPKEPPSAPQPSAKNVGTDVRTGVRTWGGLITAGVVLLVGSITAYICMYVFVIGGDVKGAKAGDCLWFDTSADRAKNGYTYADVTKTEPCAIPFRMFGNRHYVVVKRIDGSADPSECARVPGAVVDDDTSILASSLPDWVLCVKPK